MKIILAHLSLLTLLSACGAAKTVYGDQKYQICMDACKLKYSERNTKEINACRQRCNQRRQKDYQ